ncbi:MAG TPA: type VI secretion system contractile sheath small subunit [Terriglobia bacterium]|jgi:type VI secretion system protein ImpB|nr:type VI secretion system contractile sheath small subunit [Terriglobia bacterium]
MARESTQTKLSRVRPPRVQITYDVQVGDAIELKEIPFVLGVLADLSGNPTEELARLRDRKFVEVTPDNFDDVLASMKPHLAYSVENKLASDPDAPKLKVDLNFRSLEDFEPEKVARQIKPLEQLLELRTRLADLRGSLQTNQTLDDLLQEVINSSEKMQRLRTEVQAAEKAKEGGNE